MPRALSRVMRSGYETTRPAGTHRSPSYPFARQRRTAHVTERMARSVCALSEYRAGGLGEIATYGNNVADPGGVKYVRNRGPGRHQHQFSAA